MDSVNKIVLDMKYLKQKNRLNKEEVKETLIRQAFIVAIAIGFCVAGDVSLKNILLLLVGVLCVFGVYWIYKIQKLNKKQKKIDIKNFRLLETVLTDKKQDTTTDGDGFTSTSYTLVFKYCDNTLFPYEKDVTEYEYRMRNIGNKCWLFLSWNKNKMEYVLEDIFWDSLFVVSDELKGFIATADEIACKNSYKFHGVQECTIKTSDAGGEKFYSIIQSQTFLSHFGMKLLNVTDEITKKKIRLITGKFIKISSGNEINVRIYIDDKNRDALTMINSVSAQNVIPDIKQNRKNVEDIKNYLESCIRSN